MQLTIRQTADRLGKSERQVRYMIQQGSLPARKDGGRWVIDASDVTVSPGQKQAAERRDDRLRAAVEDALELSARPSKRRFSLQDLRAFKVGAAVYRDALTSLGEAHPAVTALHRGLEHLARGCHRFERNEKVHAYRLARDDASLAACALALGEHPQAAALLERVEQELMGAMAGLLQRVDRRRA